MSTTLALEALNDTYRRTRASGDYARIAELYGLRGRATPWSSSRGRRRRDAAPPEVVSALRRADVRGDGGRRGTGRGGPSQPPSPAWVPDGEVSAVAVLGSTAYIGGQFNRIGPLTGPSAALDPASGKLSGAWPDVLGIVRAAIPDGAGGWFLGGGFTAVGGVERQNLAHVRPNGTLDPAWAPSTRGEVRTLVRQGVTVYAGGRFDQANGTPRGGIAGFDVTTGELRPFAGSVGGGPATVDVLAIGGIRENRTLYAGGSFSAANGLTRNNLAAFAINDSSLRAFDPNVNAEVLSLEVSGATVYAAGEFTGVNGSVLRRHLAAFDVATGNATAWDPDVNGPVRAIDLVGSTLYAGGEFSAVNDRLPVAPKKGRQSLAAFDVATGVASSWAPQLRGPFADGALTLAAVGSTVYVGGIFSEVDGGTPRRNAAAFDASTGAPTAFDPQPDPNGVVAVIAGDGTRVVAGGSFRTLGGVERSNIAAIDLETGRPTAFAPKLDAGVSALAVAGSKLWAGGSFSRVGTTVRQRLAAFDVTSGNVTSFSQGIDQPVDALAVSGSTVYAAGRFTAVNGVSTRRHVLVFRDIAGTTGALTTIDPDVDGPVKALALSGQRVYLGGEFATVGGAARRNLAAVNTSSGAVAAFRADVDATVRALAVNATTLYAGGDFTMVAGSTQRLRLVALDAQTAAVRAWKADADGPVRTLAFAGSQLIAGGDFGTIGGAARSYLAALDPATGAVSSWRPKLTTSRPSGVHAVAATQPDGVVAGGAFSIPFGPVRAESFAVFAPRTTTPATVGAGTP